VGAASADLDARLLESDGVRYLTAHFRRGGLELKRF
jgi:hypothetical protein